MSVCVELAAGYDLPVNYKSNYEIILMRLNYEIFIIDTINYAERRAARATFKYK